MVWYCVISNPWFIVSNYSPEDISQAGTKRSKIVAESQPAIEPPAAKKQKLKAVNNSQPAVGDAQDFLNQFETSKSKEIVDSPITASTNVTDTTKPSEKLSGDSSVVSEKSTTSTTTNLASTNSDTSSSRTNASSNTKPTAPGGGRVIKIKRRKLPVNKENVDVNQSTELQKFIPEPDSIPESHVETTQLPM